MISKCRLTIVVCCVAAHVIGLLCYLMGYFPTGVSLPGNADQDGDDRLRFVDDRQITECERKKLSQPSDNVRVVLMVVDALRADFVYPGKLINAFNAMPYLKKMLKDGSVAQGYTAVVQSPTVTMPRIKAITAGIVPAFVDFALNVASAEFGEDNLIAKLKEKRKIVTFFGDDTWIRLFPNHFTRHDGTTSFIVTDFYEVDNNVTRHLDKELTMSDWKMMILHYLGLDHIGHYCGPTCDKLIIPKLNELDEIVKKLYTSLSDKSSDFVIVVLGDHGMSDSGSHGGSSLSETMVPLIFLSPLLKPNLNVDMREVQQVDLVPTLARFLNVDIPKHSLGVYLEPVENVFNNSLDILFGWRKNVYQLMNRFIASVDSRDFLKEKMILDDITIQHNNFVKDSCLEENSSSTDSSIVVDLYRNFAEKIRRKMMSSFVNYDTPMLFYSTFVCSVANGFLIYILIQHADVGNTLQQKYYYSSPFVFFLIVHAISFVSTSFIEEEHQTWYFIWTTFVLILFWRCAKQRNYIRASIVAPFLVVLILHRICREWNRTGDKWRHLEDFGDWLAKIEHFGVLNILSIAGIFVGCLCVLKRLKIFAIKITFLFGIVFVFWYKYATDWAHLQYTLFVKIFYFYSRGIWQARCVYLLATILLFQCKLYSVTSMGSLYMVSLILVKTWNIPLLTFVILLTSALNFVCSMTRMNSYEKLIVYYSSMACCYFYVGHSNSIGHIDVASGYVGLSNYNPVLVGALMLLHFYCCPLLIWLSFVDDNKCTDNNAYWLFLLCITKNLPTCFFLILAYFQRYHLFVWSVFAPKLLYECCHSSLICILSLFSFVYYLLCKCNKR